MRLIDADDVDNHIVGSVNLSGCPTINAIPIPENATNGDVIKAVFSDAEPERRDNNMVIIQYKPFFRAHDSHIDWWNAPYKQGLQ